MPAVNIVRAGEGKAYEEIWKFKSGSLTGQRFDFMVGEVPYLGGPPLHTHDEQDDTFFVLAGVLTVQVNDEIFDLAAGDFATVPPGIPHTFDNVRKDQAGVKVANLMTPGGLDETFLELSRLGDGASAGQLGEIFARHGVRMIGPTIGQKLGLR